MGAYLSLSGSGRVVGWGWALIRGWALIKFFCLQDGRLFELGANSRLGAYSNKYGNQSTCNCLYEGSGIVELVSFTAARAGVAPTHRDDSVGQLRRRRQGITIFRSSLLS